MPFLWEILPEPGGRVGLDDRIIDGMVEQHGAHLEDGSYVFRGEMAPGREKVVHVLARQLVHSLVAKSRHEMVAHDLAHHPS